MSGIEVADAKLTAAAGPSASLLEDVSETSAERAGAWAFELTGEGLPEEVAYNEHLLVVAQAEDSHRSLKTQLHPRMHLTTVRLLGSSGISSGRSRQMRRRAWIPIEPTAGPPPSGRMSTPRAQCLAMWPASTTARA